MKITNTPFLAILFILFACGNNHQPSHHDLTVNNRQLPLISTLKKQIRQHKRCTLKKNCSYQHLTFQPHKPKTQDTNNTILILDSERQPAFSSSFFRHKDRVLTYLRQLERHQGYYSSYRPILKTPKLLTQLYMTLHNEKNNFSVLDSQATLRYDILKLHHHTRFLFPNNHDISHGEYVFFILADSNPKASFIVAPFPEVTPETFCSMKENWKDITQYYQRSFDSLSYFIKKYNVRYINLSYATTMSRLNDHNKNLCQGSLSNTQLFTFFQLKSTFLDKLSNEHPNVLFVAAIPNQSPSLIKQHDPYHAFSCKKRPNVIRVGFWNQFTHRVTAEGTAVHPGLLPTDQKNLLHCGDLFINGGIDESKINHAMLHLTPRLDHIPRHQQWWHANSLHFVYHGIYSYPIRAMSTSWATPVALSLLRFLEQKHQFMFNNPISLHTIRELTQGKLLDPLKFKQLPKFLNDMAS